MIQSLFCFMITVNLGKFTFTITITNLSCKHLMKPSLLMNFVLQKEIIFHGCLKHFNYLAKQFAVKKQLQITLKNCAYIIIKKTFLSLPFVSHGTTSGKKPYKNLIFNYILDYIYSKFSQLLSSWNQDILQPNKLTKLHWVC